MSAMFSKLTDLIFGKKANLYILYLRFASEEGLHEMDMAFEEMNTAVSLCRVVEESIWRIKQVRPGYEPTISFSGIISEKAHEKISRSRRLLNCYELICDEKSIDALKSVKIGFQQLNISTLEVRRLFMSDADADDGEIIQVSSENISIIGQVISNVEDSYLKVVCEKMHLDDLGFSNFAYNVLSNQNIQSLKMSDCSVYSKNCINGVKEALNEYHPNLKELNLSNNIKIGDEAMKSLSTGLGKTSLENLDLSWCGVTQMGMKFLSVAFLSIHLTNSLCRINLSGNELRKEGMQFLSGFIRKAKNLKCIELSNTDSPMDEVLQAILANEDLTRDGLKELDISYGKLKPDGVKKLAEILSKTRSLSQLRASGMRFSFQDMKTLFQGILANKDSGEGKVLNLSLRLDDNSLDNYGDFLVGQPCRCIKVLDLSKSQLKIKSLLRLLEDVKNLRHLHTLKLNKNVRTSHFNSGDELIGKAVAELSHSLPTLEYLSIEGDLDYYSVKNSLKPFFESLAQNHTLCRLDVGYNRLTADDYVAISAGLKGNTCLRMINFDNNKANYKCMIAVLNVIKMSESLTDALPHNDLKTLMKTKNNKYLLTLKLAVDEINNRFLSNKNKAQVSNDLKFRNDYEFLEKVHQNTNEEELEVQKGKQFGVDLVDIMGTTKLPQIKARIPTILVKMKQYLFQEGGHLKVGIFRLAPDNIEAEKVVQELDNGVFSACKDINCIANSIKVFLRRMPTRILEKRVLERLLNPPKQSSVSSALDQEDRADGGEARGRREKAGESSDDAFGDALEKNMDEPFLSMFLWLADLIVDVSAHQSANKMSVKNLVIVIGPNLLDNINLEQSEKVFAFIEEAVAWRKRKLEAK